MKFKRRRVLEVPPKIKAFISNVTSAALENIEEPLKDFVWEFDKGDFHHWVDLFNHFDSFFEKYIKPRKDLQVEDNFLDADPPFPREAILRILRVTRIILENCTNKHFYTSYEQHLSLLLASADADVLEASLQTLTAFLKKTVGKCCIRDASWTPNLFTFLQGWGCKEEGLGLIACSLCDGCDSVVSGIGSTLHFEFYAVGDASQESSGANNMSKGLQVIHLPNVNLHDENNLALLNNLVKEYDVPHSLRFSLWTRLRFARAFDSLSSRHQFIRIRLYAFIAFVHVSNDTDELASFFNSEPEFINELVSLLSYEDAVPEEIRILGIQSLVALCQCRAHQPTVLAAVTSGGQRGILPSLMQKAVDSITSGSTKCSIVFAEGLLSLVSVMVSSTPGSLALREVGFIPTILPLLKDASSQHLHLVTTAVHVIEGFLEFNNPATALFRDLGGLDETIARLKVEILNFDKGSKKSVEPQNNSKGKQVMVSLPEQDAQPLYSEAVVSYHRKLLMKALLRTISLATYVPGSNARVDGSEENLLPHCLCTIFKRAKEFGGGVFSLAANVMNDLIHKDPTCYPVLDAAELPRAFVDAIMSGVLCSAEALTCIPPCLDALCLNNSGLQLVRDRNALMCFVKIFTSRSYLRALSGDAPGTLSGGLDELMRHQSSLRASGVDMLIEILSTILKMGSGTESPLSMDSSSSSTTVPMETDLEDKSISLGEQESSMNETSLDGTSVSLELFLPECISNVGRVLETVLQNADTCRIFIDKKGIDVALKLFTLQSLPVYNSIGQSISVAFKNFSPQHSSALARAVCTFMREHLKLTNELLISLCRHKLAEIECTQQTKILKCLSSLEGLLSLSNFLLKGTTTMIMELASGDADILKDLGLVYSEVLWQISLSSDSKVDEKSDVDQEAGSGDASVSNVAGRESDDDGNVVPLVRYMNPVSIRNPSASQWNVEQDFASVVRSAERIVRHGRHGFSRARGGRISRQLDSSHMDAEGSVHVLENPLIQDIKTKSTDVLVSEVLMKFALTIRSFYATLVKGLSARRRNDSNSLNPASKSLVTALAKLFHDALSYSGYCTDGSEMPLSVKCQFLGKVVNDMAGITFDSRRRSCNTALVNSFYVNGTFKELLTTFEATSQLLWALPFSVPTPGIDQGSSLDGNKLSHSSWLLETMQNYCRLLEYFVNSSLLLSPTSPSQVQLLVQPAATGLSIGLFSVPRDPEVFVRMLQSQVLDVILPIWNHPKFPECNPALLASIVSIVTHIYSGVGDLHRDRRGTTGSPGQRLTAPPLDESTITTIVEMGFTRARAEEALRSIGTNSVEMATDWLFSHPEEFVQEDVQLAQALALSLGNSSETSKEDNTEKAKDSFTEERGAVAPPVDDILSASMGLFRTSDSIAFSLTDLILTLCTRNKGEDRPKVVLYLVQQLKLCPSDFSKDTGALGPVSHILALLLSEDGSTREIAAENGIVSVVLDFLMSYRARGESINEPSLTKCISTLLLILDSMLQHKPRVATESSEVSSRSLDSSGAEISLATPLSTNDKKSVLDGLEKESDNVFENILGKSTGYLTSEESQRALEIACEFIKQNVPAVVMQAVLQLCARLTKTHALATQFLESGGLSALFSFPKNCSFPWFDSLASAIIRHLLEDPQTLQIAMELEIRQSLTGNLNRHAGRLSPRLFLTSMAPVISRDPAIFMRAAASVCQLESSGGRMSITLLKEKDKDKEKAKAPGIESGAPSSEPIRIVDSKPSDAPGKCSRSHKRVPMSLFQVIDQLLEIVTSYPSSLIQDACTSTVTPMDVDEPVTKEKGKSKVDDTNTVGSDCLNEKSDWMAKVTFVLKLMSEILLMYVQAVGVILRRDSETCQLRGSGQAGGLGHGGIVHHILHHLLPLSSDKSAVSSDKCKDKLSEKASWFLVVLCGRSTEGRRRVICEIVKAFSSFSNLEGNSTKGFLLPDKKVLAFADLVNSILSKNSSNSLPGPGCSPDIAKAMIDGGMVQSLSSILRVIDLDHPDAPKLANLMVKALETLTRAANAVDQVLKLDGINKKRLASAHGRTEDQANIGTETANRDRNEANNTVQTGDRQVQESSRHIRDDDADPTQPTEENMVVDRNQNVSTNTPVEHGVEFMRAIDDSNTLPNTHEVGISFRVDHRTDDDMGEEDDEDMGEDGEDEDEDDEEDDEDDEDVADEGATMMSLADTDVEDHDDNGLGDQYHDDMIDEEEDDFPENRVIEVRWREGLGGLDHMRVLRGSGESSGFIDIAGDPFPGLSSDDIFHIRRPLGVERRRQSGGRTSLERSGLEGSFFQHPLLLRPSQSGEPNTSMWPSVGNSSRDLDALSFGSFDVARFYMYDPALPSDHAAATIFGDRMVGSAQPPLIDFSLGTGSMHIGGRRGPGDSRWTDNGQPQAGGQAAAIAQAVEEQFVSQLRGATSESNPSAQRQSEHSAGQFNQQSLQLNVNNQTSVAVDDPSPQQTEGQSQELENNLLHHLGLAAVGDEGIPSLPPETIDEHFVGGAQESLRAAEFAQALVYSHNDRGDSMHVVEEPREGLGPNPVHADAIPEIGISSADLQNADQHMRDDSDVFVTSQSAALQSTIREEPSDNLLDLRSVMPDFSTDRTGSIHVSADFDMNGTDTTGNEVEPTVLPSCNGEESSAGQNVAVPHESSLGDQANVNSEASSTNAIDPTFLDALPEDLRAEVLANQQASQQAQPSQTATYDPPTAQEIDPEFLAALPPEIQAEVLAQQRAQRIAESQQAEGQPVDMDNASIIATFPPDLREEVLLTSSEAVLSALPSALLAEAQMLRDRAVSHYHARSSLFGGSHRLGGRRLAIDRQTVMDRGVGVTLGRRAISSVTNSLKVKEVEGVPLLDTNALKALIRLLRLAQPLSKGLLQRLLLNLCAHSSTRATLVHLLVDTIRPETGCQSMSETQSLQRLYGCQRNVVHGRPQPLSGLPPVVSRRVLEILTYLATNHSSVANLLFHFDPSLIADSQPVSNLDDTKEKGKEKISVAEHISNAVETSIQCEIPLVLFLKLLNQPLFLRSSAHLEQVMGLLQVVINNAVAKIDFQPHSVQAGSSSENQEANGASSDAQRDSVNLERNPTEDTNRCVSAEVPSLDGKKVPNPYDILLQFPESDLRNLCSLLAHEGLSDKIYSLAAEVVKKLASVAVPHQKFFAFELAGLAHSLSYAAVGELATLRSTHMLGLSAASMAGTAILRVLQALSGIISVDENRGEVGDGEHEEHSILSNLNIALEPLWQELSDCISTTEAKLEKCFSCSSPTAVPDAGDLIVGASSLSPPLPPGTQRLLPFIEAFFVLSEKLQMSQSISQTDNITLTKEGTDFSGSSPSPSKCGGAGTITFSRVVEKHRRLLNVFIRQNPSLLEKSLSMMLKVPRLIDFDNKRAYFRSRIRQQHDQLHSAPLRISVRRSYILEDSYNQLRMRSTQDLKGRLTVQFQGEEGIDAGGLTREWYQLLSRVIFDKGALLFTTVGNNATFQPNPNSVYQTEHLSYFKFVGRVVAKALFDGQLLDVYFTRSFYKHILGVKVTYHDIEAVDPDYYKNLKWMLENDVSDIPDLTFSMDADEEKHILYEKTEVTDYELKPGGRNIRVTEETKHEYVDLVAGHILTTAIRPQINSFLEGFNELIPRDLISIFNDKELELLISGLPEIDLDDLRVNTEYTGYTVASPIIHWFWEIVKAFNKEDMARLLQFVTGTSKVPLEGFKALQGISGPQRFQIHKAYGSPERLPSAHTCFNQLDLPEYSSKEQLEERLLLAIHEASEGFGFG